MEAFVWTMLIILTLEILIRLFFIGNQTLVKRTWGGVAIDLGVAIIIAAWAIHLIASA